jgi:hypothetical protein
MNLIDFKKHIESFDNETEFKYGISEPFSWRGSYDEVAFSIVEEHMTKEEILENIEKAYTEKFYGYKGGEYNYFDYTTINFENGDSNYSDGGYCSDMIAKLEENIPYQSQEERLVKLAFKINELDKS